MPFVECECPRCKQNTIALCNQGLHRGDVSFFIEYRCECGFFGEVEYLTTPERFRNEIIKESGLWQLKCYDKLNCLKFLRQKYLYSIEQIKELKKQDVITFEGTEIEMRVLGKKMEVEGIKVLVARIK